MSSEVADSLRPTEIVQVNKILNGVININQVIDQITRDVRDLVRLKLENIPISVAQDYVFPGGNIFTVKEVVFSKNQDMVIYINHIRSVVIVLSVLLV